MPRPKSHIVDSTNSPKLVPVNWRGGTIGITATPSGGGNYTIEATMEDISPDQDDVAGSDGAQNVVDWVGIEDLVATGDQVRTLVGVCTALRITVNSGASVKVDVVQTDE